MARVRVSACDKTRARARARGGDGYSDRVRVRLVFMLWINCGISLGDGIGLLIVDVDDFLTSQSFDQSIRLFTDIVLMTVTGPKTRWRHREWEP